MDENKYGKLLTRFKAILIDGLILMGLGILVSTIFSQFKEVNNSIRAITFVLVFFLYDPMMTSFIGATIGHMIIGLKVRREKDETRKIIFPLAFIRFIIKASLGWLSLITVSSSKKGKAIHDSIVGSVVLEK
jgi:uncharacterized RDD family membrane protein YckC